MFAPRTAEMAAAEEEAARQLFGLLPEVWAQVRAALREHAERGGFDHE